MSHSDEVFFRESDEMLWYFNEADGAMKADVRSVSNYEAQAQAYSGIERHRRFLMNFEFKGKVVRREYIDGTDLACGCSVHSSACLTKGGRKRDRPEIASYSLASVRDASKTTGAMEAADASWRDRGRDWSQRPSVVLGLRFGSVLLACRAHPPEWMLSEMAPRPGGGCLVPFGVAGVGATVRRARPMAGAIGVKQTLLRGAGSIAHLTDLAREAYAESGSRRSVQGWLAAKGMDLCSGAAGSEERSRARAWAAAVKEEAEQLERDVLQVYRYARPRNLPRQVVRAGRSA